MKKRICFLGIFLIVSTLVVGQTTLNPIDQGKSFFQAGNYREALSLFRDSLSDPRYVPFRAESYFWTGKTLFALNRFEEARRNFDFFLAEFPDDRNVPEARYLQSRTYFLQDDFESATLMFARFIQNHPRSPFVPNAYYWAAESFFLLGNLSEAQRLFEIIVDQFSTSTRFEPARYRLDVLRLYYREQELMQLLQWTQEESLRNTEAFVRQVATYRQAIDSLQNQRTSSITQDQFNTQTRQIENLETQIRTLQSRNDLLTTQIRDLSINLNTTQSLLEQAQRETGIDVSESGDSDTLETIRLSRFREILQIKEESLGMKEKLIEKLLEAIQ